MCFGYASIRASSACGLGKARHVAKGQGFLGRLERVPHLCGPLRWYVGPRASLEPLLEWPVPPMEGLQLLHVDTYQVPGRP